MVKVNGTTIKCVFQSVGFLSILTFMVAMAVTKPGNGSLVAVVVGFLSSALITICDYTDGCIVIVQVNGMSIDLMSLLQVREVSRLANIVLAVKICFPLYNYASVKHFLSSFSIHVTTATGTTNEGYLEP